MFLPHVLRGFARRSFKVPVVIGSAVSLVVLAATAASAGEYELISRYSGDASTVAGWTYQVRVPKAVNGNIAAVVPGGWFDGLETGIYSTGAGDNVTFNPYVFSGGTALSAFAPDCTQNGSHTFGTQGTICNQGSFATPLKAGDLITFKSVRCSSSNVAKVAGAYICAYAYVGGAYHFMGRNLNRAAGPEMYTHDIETFPTEGQPGSWISCTQPLGFTKQTRETSTGKWVAMSNEWVRSDGSSRGQYRRTNVTSTSWDVCSTFSGDANQDAFVDWGDAGDVVRCAQSILSMVDGYSLGSTGVDGRFDASTASAVTSYQANHGLVSDGKVDVHTAQALWRDLQASSSYGSISPYCSPASNMFN